MVYVNQPRNAGEGRKSPRQEARLFEARVVALDRVPSVPLDAPRCIILLSSITKNAPCL
jgi:hypothetical protein